MFIFDSNCLGVPNELLFIQITKFLIVFKCYKCFSYYSIDICILGVGKILNKQVPDYKAEWNKYISC